ncbi:hypothetical protein XELAEV_18028592mg [Xenopus laevis]|uniref:Uncharacterized protein n=1 Tax=Xenopus laevis TaxID=8355 RepID=A0A974CPZ5_XENLA|nr:hypothetical protein XELAEV_18028592mg [Xenopus laevis]
MGRPNDSTLYSASASCCPDSEDSLFLISASHSLHETPTALRCPAHNHNFPTFTISVCLPPFTQPPSILQYHTNSQHPPHPSPALNFPASPCTQPPASSIPELNIPASSNPAQKLPASSSPEFNFPASCSPAQKLPHPPALHTNSQHPPALHRFRHQLGL